MNTYRIFLASSCELKKDRNNFEIYIRRQNELYEYRNIKFELTIWEDFHDEIALNRKQDEYNEAIKKCDIFVLLFWTKVGKYTNEEFDIAISQFKKDKIKPKIYTYYNTSPKLGCITTFKDTESINNFKKKLVNLGHYPTEYTNIDELKNHFTSQLEKLINTGFIKFDTNTNTKTVVNVTNIGRQINMGQKGTYIENLGTLKKKNNE